MGRLSATPPPWATWQPRSTSRSTPTTASLRTSDRGPRPTRTTSPSRIWFFSCSRLRHHQAPPCKSCHTTRSWHNQGSHAQAAQLSFFCALSSPLLLLCFLVLVDVVINDLSHLPAHCPHDIPHGGLFLGNLGPQVPC